MISSFGKLEIIDNLLMLNDLSADSDDERLLNCLVSLSVSTESDEFAASAESFHLLLIIHNHLNPMRLLIGMVA